MLRLDAPLPERFDNEGLPPVLEKDVRREECSPSLATDSGGACAVGEEGWVSAVGELVVGREPARSRLGMSMRRELVMRSKQRDWKDS